MNAQEGITILVIVLAGILSGFGVALSSYDVGVANGRRQVASGQWECHLEQKQDKTSTWACDEASDNERKRH